MALAFPRPRPPLDPDAVRRWYEQDLGWPVTGGGGGPVELVTGLQFDVLELPAAAGFAVLRRGVRTGPVALDGRRMGLLVSAGSAEQLPELLDWLEWGGVALDLFALGAGCRMPAPRPTGTREAADGRTQPVWLRPPEPGRELEPTLPSACLGGDRNCAPDLVRLVGAAATECHRARLLRAAGAQPLAFSYASRMFAGTRPRSLTS
ncbi:SCO3374 family protein [Streptomyces sp. KR80]|uniref:SCO3374 family protein n=1 Tax=Streptomyces sp. KR80 TaxID=3457426 RepID=UPI003FCFC4E6